MTMHHDTVGFLAARSLAAARVLSRHGIEFCCCGGRRLDDACAVVGLDPERLVAEVTTEEAAASGSTLSWCERPLADLVRHLVSAYHVPWRAEFPRCLFLGREVAVRHAERDGDRLCALARVLEALADEFEGHLEREEQVLFPWIAAGHGATAGAPIRVAQTEHRSVIRWFAEIRELTDNLQVPPAAGRDLRALLAGLSPLDAQLRQHIHLENNVLFPRALAG